MAKDDDGDDDELPCVDHDPLNEGAVLKRPVRVIKVNHANRTIKAPA